MLLPGFHAPSYDLVTTKLFKLKGMTLDYGNEVGVGSLTKTSES